MFANFADIALDNADALGQVFDRADTFGHEPIVLAILPTHIVGQVGGLDDLRDVGGGGKLDDSFRLLIEPRTNKSPNLIEYPRKLIDANVGDRTWEVIEFFKIC